MSGLRHDLEAVRGYEDLYVCRVCNAAEGELLSYCPGYRLNAETLDACYTGNVIDLEGQRRYRQAMIGRRR